MAKQATFFAVRDINTAAQNFENADGTTAKDIISAGANDSLIRALSIVSQDSVTRIFDLILHNGTTDYLIGAVTVPANSGFDGTEPPVNGLDHDWMPLDGRDKKFIPMKAGWKLRAKAKSAVSGMVTFAAIAEDY